MSSKFVPRVRFRRQVVQDDRFGAIKRWLRRIRLSRIIRWAIFAFILIWLYNNWHNSIDPKTQLATYGFPESGFVDVDGMAVHYRSTGTGKPLLLLHDAHNSMHSWKGWHDSLSAKNRVISIDLPGFGLTGPHPRGSYSAFMYASFLDSLVKKLDLKKFNLAGNGLGAQIAWQYVAESDKNNVDNLILLDSPGFEPKETSWIAYLAKTPVINRAFLKITPRMGVRIMLEEIYADDSEVTDALVQRHFDLFLCKGNRKAFTDYASVSDNRPPVDLIENIRIPTMILWGAEDTRISPEYAYEFHRKIRSSVLKIYRNTGHWPQEENPVETARDVQAFLEGRF